MNCLARLLGFLTGRAARWGGKAVKEDREHGGGACSGNWVAQAAVELLLAAPESLGDDVLESCLYLLRERLRAA